MSDEVPDEVPRASTLEWWVCKDPDCKALHVGLLTEDGKWIATHTVSRDSLDRMLAFLEAEKPRRPQR
jgi:hypothetical protein